ncbi:MAG: amidohydrolase family protein [Clostridiales bacterium]|nr:amidohydrolase family protein [Clostridiales bacterium]
MYQYKVLKNGKIWTGDKSSLWKDVLVTEGEKIVYTGNGAVPAEYCVDAEVYDLNKKMVIPSLIDSHIHISALAQSTYFYVMENTDTLEVIQENIRKYANAHPEQAYIYVESCPTVLMDDPRMTKAFLDAIVPDRPVLLCDASFHRALLNTRMLELMEITPENHSHGGLKEYELNENGELTGIAYEHAYDDDLEKMYQKIGWYPPDVSTGDVMLPFLDMFSGWGVSCILDGLTESEKTLQGMRALEEAGKLHFYFHGTSLFTNIHDLDDAICRLREWQKKYGSRHVILNTMKLFLDGTNEIGTSAVIEPFANDPAGENRGSLQLEQAELAAVFVRLQEEELNIQIHMVGDRAFRTALDAAEDAKKILHERGQKLNIRINFLHCELTKPEDRKRPAKLGVHINWSPQWSGGIFGEDSMLYLGRERFESMYSFNEIIRSGAVVGYSSDVVDIAEIHRANPFAGIQIGHTRIDPDAGGVLRQPADERISREDLLYGYTVGNARQVGMEDSIGMLKPGMLANIAVLNKDYFEIDADAISSIRADRLMFEGEWVFSG